jgi:hypothetical protein
MHVTDEQSDEGVTDFVFDSTRTENGGRQDTLAARQDNEKESPHDVATTRDQS